MKRNRLFMVCGALAVAVGIRLPQGATAWFLNVHSGGPTVSSDFQETP